MPPNQTDQRSEDADQNTASTKFPRPVDPTSELSKSMRLLIGKQRYSSTPSIPTHTHTVRGISARKNATTNFPGQRSTPPAASRRFGILLPRRARLAVRLFMCIIAHLIGERFAALNGTGWRDALRLRYPAPWAGRRTVRPMARTASYLDQ